MRQVEPIVRHSADKVDETLRVLMICGHDPTADPRVLWEAESASDSFDTTVLGFNRDDGSKPLFQQLGGYSIIRLTRRDFSLMQYFLMLKNVVPWTSLVGLGLVLLLASPLILARSIIVQIVRPAFRLMPMLARALYHRTKHPLSSVVLPESRSAAIKSTRHLRNARGPLARMRRIFAVMLHQFTPATVQFWNYFLTARQIPNIVHCNDLDTLLVGVLAKKNFGCRLVYDAHEFYPVSDPHGTWIDVMFFSWIERLLIHHADAVVTVNPMLASQMRMSYNLGPVHAVPNVEPWVEVRSKTMSVNSVSMLARGRTAFLFQGRFAAERGIEEIIQAWASVDGEKAVLFLRGPDNPWRQVAIDLAARLGILDKSVFFLDAVREDQLVEAAAEADVGIIPYKPLVINDRFSCPNKLSQYLHAGLMIIANDLPYVQSVINEAGAGLSYSSADLTTLVGVVHRIANDPALLQLCRSNALNYARKSFNWQSHVKVFHSLYSAATTAQAG